MIKATLQAMREEAKNDIIDTLSWFSGYYCDLHNEVFNTDYYIIGTYEAKKKLEEYGVFEAIEKVQEYEKHMFGELYTDISDPEKVCNMLYYIIGEEVLFELTEGSETLEENRDNLADDETNTKIISEIR
jgi:hypothetical protein